jgi:outer membrane receptor for ferrienterochelin and colicins
MKKTNFIKIFLFFLFITQFAFSQATIKGRVLSLGKPVEFVNVALLGTSFGTSTDTSGYYKIANVPAGKYEIQLSGIGYKTVKTSITLSDTKNLTMNTNLEEDLSELKEVVVTGTMKESFISESPVPVEVFTPVFFKKNPTPSIFEALQLVNGVKPQLNCSVCNTGDIHINGMEGAYTMILIDGMPIVSSLATVYGLNGIPNSMIERIEIVKGPASTLYGSEAVAGLINIITKAPSKAANLTLDIFGTSYGEYSADLATKLKVGKATSILSANYFNFNTIWDKNQDGFTDVTLQNRISIFNKWNFERKNNRIASVALRYLYEDRWGGQTAWKREFRGGEEIYGESIFTNRFELIGVYQLPFNKEKLLFSYSFNNHDQDSRYGTTSYIANQKVAFGQLTWDKKLGKRHDFLFGTALRYTFYDDNTPTTADEQGNNKPDNIALPGVFVQDEITLTKNQKLLLGARYDYHPRHGNVFSPRANYKLTLNKDNILRISYGNGFRVVNLFTEDHAALTGARQVVIREALNPERSWNLNLNFQKFINTNSGLLSFDFSTFYTYFNNKIVADYFTDANKIIYDNINGYAISKGVSLNTDFVFTFPLKINIGATLMDVYQVENDQKMAQVLVSPFSGTFTVGYTFSKPQITVDWTGNFYSPMPLAVVPEDYRPDHSPWYSVQNIQLTKTFPSGFQIYGGIKNLLNFMPREDVILRAFDPFDKQIEVNNPNGYTFDPTYMYAPMQGIRGFAGIRYNLFK